VDEELANGIDRAFIGFRPWMRTMKDGGHSVQSGCNPAPSSLGNFASRGTNQRFNRRPAYIRSRWTEKNAVERVLLRLIHGKETGPFWFLHLNNMIAQTAI
jgi:hypothetical protein